VNALDSLYLQRYLVNLPVTFLSAPPVTSVTQTTGLDPVIRLPKNLTAYRGQNIQVPVELQNTDPQAIQVNSFEVDIAIDPKSFKLLKIQSDATIKTRYDARKGILVIGGILPDVTLKPGESLIIAKLNLKVAGHAVATDYALNLLDQARIGKEQYATSVNGGTLVLIPAPTSGANDPVDGVVKVVERSKPVVAGGRHRKHRFLGN